MCVCGVRMYVGICLCVKITIVYIIILLFCFPPSLTCDDYCVDELVCKLSLYQYSACVYLLLIMPCHGDIAPVVM